MVLLSVQTWATSPRKFQLSWPVPEVKTAGFGGLVILLTDAVLLNWDKAARSCHRIQPVANLLCRQWHLQSTVSKTNSESKPYLKCRIGIENYFLLFKLYKEIHLFVLWSAVFTILEEWRLGEKRLPRNNRDFEGNSAEVSPAKSAQLHPCICKQICLHC